MPELMRVGGNSDGSHRKGSEMDTNSKMEQQESCGVEGEADDSVAYQSTRCSRR